MLLIVLGVVKVPPPDTVHIFQGHPLSTHSHRFDGSVFLKRIVSKLFEACFCEMFVVFSSIPLKLNNAASESVFFVVFFWCGELDFPGHLALEKTQGSNTRQERGGKHSVFTDDI